MLWRLLIPTAFPVLPDKCISVSGFGPPLWGGCRREGGCPVSSSPCVIAPVFPSGHPALSLLILAFPFFCSLLHWRRLYFCLAVCGESCVIKCCHIFLDFSHLQIPHSFFPCKDCGFFFFFFLTRAHLCLTIAHCVYWCCGLPWSHLRTAFSASPCRCPLEWEHTQQGQN